MLRITAMDMRPAAADYLLRATGCAEFREAQQETERALERAAEVGDAVAYYAAAVRDGESPGTWTGKGVEALGLAAGDLAGVDEVRALLGEHLHPETGQRLGAAPRNYKSREERFAAAAAKEPRASFERLHEIAKEVEAKPGRNTGFYDMTYSAPKGVSVYHAALLASGQTEMAEAVAQAHRDAIAEAHAYLETEACFTRLGRHTSVNGAGVGRRERGAGFLAVSFDHSTSRSSDPHLHTHTAIVNRTLCSDGTWRAVDGGAWQQHKAEAAERYERTLAARIEAVTPARFAAAPGGLARDIVGMTSSDISDSSSRRREILGEQNAALAEFRTRWGREPTLAERRSINRATWARTRPGKSHKGPAAQREAWAAQEHIDPEALVAQVATAGRDLDWQRETAVHAGIEATGERKRVITTALAEVQSRSAVWKRGELRAAISLHLPVDTASEEVTALVDEALEPRNGYGALSVARPEPVPVPGWWRDESSGESVWRDPKLGAWALASHLAAESELCAWAAQPVARSMTSTELRQAETQLAERGHTLDEGQLSALFGVLGSEKAADVLVAPAGTGKSYTCGVLGQLWAEHHGGTVLGLATSERAAGQLREDGLEALNTTQFLNAYERDQHGRIRRSLGHRDLLIVDEAGMSDTAELVRIQRLANDAGAKLLYVGDPEQLPAVGQVGALKELAHRNGAFELQEVHRFAAEWERDASLRLRAGDAGVVDVYEAHGRLRGGTAEDLLEQATRAYVADTRDGKTSLLVTGSNEHAAEVSAHVQDLRVRLGDVGLYVHAQLRDGTDVRTGDLLQCRQNDYSLTGRGVANRELLVVTGRDGDSLICERKQQVTDDETSTVVLPAAYVAEHVALGYAGTQHTAQGMSVDTCHALVPQYVAMSRGRESNIAYLETERPETAEQAGVGDVTAAGVLRDALSRESVELAAVAHHRQEMEASRSLGTVTRIWDIVGEELAADRHQDLILDTLGATRCDQLLAEDGHTPLLRSMRRAEMRGHDVEGLWRQAVGQRDFAGAHDLSRVLRARFERLTDDTAPARDVDGWAERAADTEGVLGEFHAEVAALADSRTRELGRQVAEAPPVWARELVGDVPDDQQQRREWEQRAGRIAAYREQCNIVDEQVSIGAAPHEDDPQKRIAWESAARASNRPTDGLDYRHRPDAELVALVAEAARLDAWAPAWVHEQQGQAHAAAAQNTTEASLLRGEAAATRDELEAERLAEAAQRAQRLADRMTERAGMLDEVAATRREWMAHTEPARDAADAAQAELSRRDYVSEKPQVTEQEVGLFTGEDLTAVDVDELRVEIDEPQRSLFDDTLQRSGERGLTEVREQDLEQDEQQTALLAPMVDAAAEARVETIELDTETASDQPERDSAAQRKDGQERSVGAAVAKARMAANLMTQRRRAAQERAEQQRLERRHRDAAASQQQRDTDRDRETETGISL